MPEYPPSRYDQFGNYVTVCQSCGRDERPACLHCQFPRFTMLGGMRMLALGLLAHYETDREWTDAEVAELESIIGGELLDIGREFMAEHGVVLEGAEHG